MIETEKCLVCGAAVETMAYKGTNACSQLHYEAVRDQTHGETAAKTSADGAADE